jgi:hypothetical protein
MSLWPKWVHPEMQTGHWCVAYILFYKGIFSIDAQYDPNSFYFVTQMQKPRQVEAWSLAK